MSVNVDGEEEAAAAVGLLWGTRAAPTRGPKPSLSVEQIADAAVARADAEGIEAVSMQRVGESLDVTKMSLYRYLSGKSELVAVMIERAVGDPPELSRVRGSWRRRLERWAELMSAAWDAHPWVPWVTVGNRVIGPREAGWSEAAVAAMDDTPLSLHQRMDVVTTVSGLLRNTQSGIVTGTQPWHAERHAQLIREHADRFPTLSRVADVRARSPRHARSFGLSCLLDGVELHIKHLAER
jgi:AcrR family transcriptional regulator